jgi:hypothetical protein
MTSGPYPGFPPNYTNVGITGGFTRTCFVLEFLSLGRLEPAQKALVEEQVSALVDKLAKSLSNVEKAEVVAPKRFDRQLLDGLRLPSTE